MTRFFSDVYLEISPYCNGRCPYCITGRNGAASNSGFVSIDKFERILDRLAESGCVNSNANLHLYVWGEPLLHPNFYSVLEVARNFPFKICLSSNGSVRLASDPALSSISSLKFSLPGFSQQSYDRIHGFNFEKITSNILHNVDIIKSLGGVSSFLLNFHIYQFNQDELPMARNFARSLGMLFAANYAIINDWSLTQRWIDKTLSLEEALQIGSDLFMFLPAKLLSERPASYVCPQDEYLVLDSSGNISLCCQTPHSESFYSGNIFDANFQDCIKTRQHSVICKKCIASGFAFVCNNSLQTPRWAEDNSGMSSLKRCLSRVKKCFGR